MPRSARSFTPRPTAITPAVVSLIVAALVCTLAAACVLMFAFQDAHRRAEAAAQQIAARAVIPLSRYDFSALSGPTRDQVRAELHPLLASGVASRIRLWTADDDTPRLSYTEEIDLGGLTEPAAALVADRPPGEVTVAPAPRNLERRLHDATVTNLLNVYASFRDSRQHLVVLDLYVPTHIGDSEHRITLAVLPLFAGGIVVLAIALFPLSRSLSRKLALQRTEQRIARQFSISSAQATREAIARSIHNRIIPGLSGARMLLEMVPRAGSVAPGRSPGELVGKAHNIVVEEVEELRGLLSTLVPAAPGGDIEDVVATVTQWHQGDAPRVILEKSLMPPPSASALSMINGIAEELLRNAFRHAGAGQVTVGLTSSETAGIELLVSDNGSGLPARTRARSAGVGLRLSRKLVEDGGGRMTITSVPATGTTVRVWLPFDVSPS